jgi:hypothetical protein
MIPSWKWFAVETLFRRDATLLSAETTIAFMMDKLENSVLSDRRTILSNLLQYLHKSRQNQSNSSGLSFQGMAKTKITNTVVDLVQRWQRWRKEDQKYTNRNSKDVAKIVKKELSIFDNEGSRGANVTTYKCWK